MSDTRDPDRDQVAPVHNDNPSCHDLVIEDLKERKEFGLRKYNTELQAFNGRSFTQDAYEEALDICVYLRGKLEEERQTAKEQEDLEKEVEGHIFADQYGMCTHPSHKAAGDSFETVRNCWKANLNLFMRGM